MAAQKHRSMKKVFSHALYGVMGDGVDHSPANPAQGRILPAVCTVYYGIERHGKLLSKPVEVINLKAVRDRKARAIERARKDVEQALAEWAAAELKVAQQFTN